MKPYRLARITLGLVLCCVVGGAAFATGEPYFIANRGNEPKLVSTSGGTEARLVTSVDTVAELRGIRNFSATRVSVPNNGLYVWTPGSSVPDDGFAFIKPTSISGAGRYVLTTPAGGAPSGASGGDVVGTFPANLNTAPAVASVAALKAIASASRFAGHFKHLADLNQSVRWDSSIGTNLAGDDLATIQPTDVATSSPGRWVVLGTPTVPTVAALRTLKSGQHSRAYVLHYSATGDRGGGEFLYDPASTAADDAGTVFQPGFGTGSPLATGRWLRQYSGAISVAWFGAKGDGRRVLDAAVTGTALTSATAAFTSGDVGKLVTVLAPTGQTTGSVAVASGAVTGLGTAFLSEYPAAPLAYIEGIGPVSTEGASTNTAMVLRNLTVSVAAGKKIFLEPWLVVTANALVGPTQVTMSAAPQLNVAATEAVIGSNDTASIKSAIAAALTGKRDLYFPPGMYCITESLLFANATGIRVFGAGADVSTVRDMRAWLDASFPVANAYGLLSFYEVGTVTVDNLTIWGTGTGNIGANTSNYIAGFPVGPTCRKGLYVVAASGGSVTLNNFRTVRFRDESQYGLVAKVSITAGQIDSGNSNGYNFGSLEAGSSIKITGSRANNCGGYQFGGGAETCIIAHNTFSQTTVEHGAGMLELLAALNAVVDSNTFSGQFTPTQGTGVINVNAEGGSTSPTSIRRITNNTVIGAQGVWSAIAGIIGIFNVDGLTTISGNAVFQSGDGGAVNNRFLYVTGASTGLVVANDNAFHNAAGKNLTIGIEVDSTVPAGNVIVGPNAFVNVATPIKLGVGITQPGSTQTISGAGATTIRPDVDTVFVNVNGAVTANLPSPALVGDRKQIRIVNSHVQANTTTVATPVSGAIRGASTVVNVDKTGTYQSDGTDWRLVNAS